MEFVIHDQQLYFLKKKKTLVNCTKNMHTPTPHCSPGLNAIQNRRSLK